MGFTVENKISGQAYGLVKFTFAEPFTSEDMSKVLGILTSLLDNENKKPFAFYVDSRTANTPPLNAATSLISWLRKNKRRFKDQLIGSAVVMGNSIANNLLSKFLSGVFSIQPLVSPNKLTNDMSAAEDWLKITIEKFMKERNLN